MPKTSKRLEWCIVRLGEDLNWWVDEISDDVHWDLDGLSIVDPRQWSHIIELLEPLRDYDLKTDLIESAFFAFRIDKKLDDQRLRLVQINESLIESEELLFALPDLVDEDKSPYADFLDHITRLRVKMLNDLIDFERKLTIEELEEEIREEQNAHFLEGQSVHAFKEVTDVLEFVPAGYELDDEDADAGKAPEEQIEDEFPDIDESEAAEIDESWDEDEDEDDAEESADAETDDDAVATESLDDLEDDEDE